MSTLLLEGLDDGLAAYRAYDLKTFVSAGNGRTGGYGGYLETNNTFRYYWQPKAADIHNTFIVGMAVKCQLMPSGNTGYILRLLSDGITIEQLQILPQVNGSFAIKYGNGLGSTLTTPAGLFVVGTYHYLEVKVTLDDIAGSIYVQYDGIPIASVTGVDTRNGGVGGFDGMKIQNTHFGNMGNWYIDDIYVANGAGAFHNTFLGDTRIYLLLPNGNGNYSQLVGSDGDQVDNYLQADENPPSSADYNQSAVTGAKDSYSMDDLSVTVGTVSGVTLSAYAAKSDAGTKQTRLFVRHTAADAPGSDHPLTVDYAGYNDVLDADPITAAEWTITNVNSAEFGFEVRT